MLRMQLLGDLRLSRDGAELPASASRRSWVLLAWLALHRGQHPRGVVAAAFWPDVLDASARGSLRSAVWSVRRTLGVATEDYLVLDRDRIGFRDDAELRLDVDEVAELVRTGRLAEAAHAGAAELLPGLDDDWVLEARDAHRRSMLDLLETLARRAGAEGRVDEAVGWTRRQLVLDPDADEPVRRLMVLLDAAGDRTGAVRAYERHVDRLARELRTEPGEELTHLAEELRAGGGPAEVARPDQGSPAAPLVGRAAEWATLRAAWRRARSGQPGVVVVTGEPGIGKTRLVSELADLARSEGARTASTAALDLGGAAPLGPWAELVVALVPTLERPPASAAWPAVLTRLVPDLDSRFDLAPLSYSLASADLERVRLFEAMVGFLGWAASRPVMLVLDDAHAADPASLDLLAHVCRRLVDRPVLIVLTCRSLPHRAAVDDLLHAMRSRGRLFAELALGALDDEEVARLAEQVAGLDPARVAQVVATAEGNPLLATEWAGALVRGEPRPPTSLVALVRSALHPLGTGPLTMARLLAVAGRGLDHHELGNLGLGRTEEVAAEVSACPLFASGQGRLGFRHALLRDAAYDEIPEPVRLALHGRMGRMLAERGPAVASEAARHLLVAGEEDAARDQLVAAAAHARSLASLDEAVALVLEAVQLTPTDGALLVELAELEALRVHAAESDACFERAVPLLRDPADLASAWVRRATLVSRRPVLPASGPGRRAARDLHAGRRRAGCSRAAGGGPRAVGVGGGGGRRRRGRREVAGGHPPHGRDGRRARRARAGREPCSCLRAGPAGKVPGELRPPDRRGRREPATRPTRPGVRRLGQRRLRGDLRPGAGPCAGLPGSGAGRAGRSGTERPRGAPPGGARPPAGPHGPGRGGAGGGGRRSSPRRSGSPTPRYGRPPATTWVCSRCAWATSPGPPRC